MRTPSNAELAAAFGCAAYAALCAVASVAGPLPHPSFAVAAAISLCGAVLAIKG